MGCLISSDADPLLQFHFFHSRDSTYQYIRIDRRVTKGRLLESLVRIQPLAKAGNGQACYRLAIFQLHPVVYRWNDDGLIQPSPSLSIQWFQAALKCTDLTVEQRQFAQSQVDQFNERQRTAALEQKLNGPLDVQQQFGPIPTNRQLELHQTDGPIRTIVIMPAAETATDQPGAEMGSPSVTGMGQKAVHFADQIEGQPPQNDT